MKAAFVSEPNVTLQVENAPVRNPRSHAILLGTSFAGSCHADLHDRCFVTYVESPYISTAAGSWKIG